MALILLSGIVRPILFVTIASDNIDGFLDEAFIGQAGSADKVRITPLPGDICLAIVVKTAEIVDVRSK